MTFTLVPASYVFLFRDDEVLLQLRRNTGYMDGHWAAAAAGHVEWGETAEAAAHREAREELGIDGLALRFALTMQRTQGDVGSMPGSAPGGFDPIEERVDFFFTARHWTGTPTIMEPGKAADLRWWSRDALPDELVPHERLALASLGTASYVSYGFQPEVKR